MNKNIRKLLAVSMIIGLILAACAAKTPMTMEETTKLVGQTQTRAADLNPELLKPTETSTPTITPSPTPLIFTAQVEIKQQKSKDSDYYPKGEFKLEWSSSDPTHFKGVDKYWVMDYSGVQCLGIYSPTGFFAYFNIEGGLIIEYDPDWVEIKATEGNVVITTCEYD